MMNETINPISITSSKQKSSDIDLASSMEDSSLTDEDSLIREHMLIDQHIPHPRSGLNTSLASSVNRLMATQKKFNKVTGYPSPQRSQISEKFHQLEKAKGDKLTLKMFRSWE